VVDQDASLSVFECKWYIYVSYGVVSRWMSFEVRRGKESLRGRDLRLAKISFPFPSPSIKKVKECHVQS